MANKLPRRFHKEAGAGLAELMVGMAIAIVASVAIFSAFSNFEWQKARTVSGSEAQENGLMSMSAIEQDLHNAGAGVSDPFQLGCTSIFSYYNGSPIANFNLSPVAIVDGGPTASDQVIVQFSNNFIANLSTTLTLPYNQGDNNMTVQRSIGYTPGATGLSAGAIGMVANAGNCTVFQVTGSLYSGTNLQTYTTSTPNYNAPPAYQTLNSWPSYTIGSKVFDLSSLITRKYSINAKNQLQVTESSPLGGPSPTTIVLAENVVMIKAQYGIAPAGTSNITNWVSANGATWGSPSATDRNRIKAIRLAVLARSKFPEGPAVTAACTNTSGVVNTGPCVWPDTATDPAPQIKLSTIDSNWSKYRYKIYETVIPLRNVIWANI